MSDGESVTISVTVRNEGDVDVVSVIVQFFDGDPASGGVPIGSNQTVTVLLGENGIAQIDWTPPAGDHKIYGSVNQR